MSERKELNLNQLESVTGGMLSVDTVNGEKVLLRYNAKHEVIGRWKILTSKGAIFDQMKTEYWSLGDEGMVAKLLAEGKIR